MQHKITSPTAKNQVVRKFPPFSLESLRLSQNFDEAVGVTKRLTTVPVRKPNRQEFVRVRPGDEWRLDTAVFDYKEERESYLVAPDLWPDLSDDVTHRRLVLTMNRQGVLAIWPLKLPGFDGRLDAWSKSALAAAELAEADWVKLQANMSLGAYEVLTGAKDLAEPIWPEGYDLEAIFDIAFKDFRIDTLDHPAIQRLHGKI